jgi:hypothetical protein
VVGVEMLMVLPFVTSNSIGLGYQATRDLYRQMSEVRSRMRSNQEVSQTGRFRRLCRRGQA